MTQEHIPSERELLEMNNADKCDYLSSLYSRLKAARHRVWILWISPTPVYTSEMNAAQEAVKAAKADIKRVHEILGLENHD